MLPQVVHLPDLETTEQLARRLAALIKPGDVIALQGDLGTGKTTFARSLFQAMGVTGDIPSPTFTLLQTYETPHLLISHFDLYRLKSAMDLEELGWDDALAGGLAVIEWPERAVGYLPKDHLVLWFSIADEQRRICTLDPHGLWIERLKAAS